MRAYILPFLLVLITLLIFPSTNEANMQAKQLKMFLKSSRIPNSNFESLQSALHESISSNGTSSSVYVEDQAGEMEKDKISSLPGQPNVDFAQYSGYVYLDSKHEEALFYYLVEAPKNSSSKLTSTFVAEWRLFVPLFSNFSGPGCSSLGYGALMELGPFRVKSDNRTLEKNPYSWNNEANVLFLESPAGVGYSYTKGLESGDIAAARGNYVFLLNWFERFPQYKGRDFFIAGESYSGHFTPQLASLILHHNDIDNNTKINLRGIMMGNAYIDEQINDETTFEYLWSHALISNKVYDEIKKNCNFSASVDSKCTNATDKAEIGSINLYNIYAPICTGAINKSHAGISGFDPCSEGYVKNYLNDVAVKEAFHVSRERNWEFCRNYTWKDSEPSMHALIKQLISDGLTIWLYSGDVDSIVPVTATRRSVMQLGLPITKEWHPWYHGTEVGGFAVQHRELVLMTVRGAGHMVPSDKPERALALISSFLQAKLSPPS